MLRRLTVCVLALLLLVIAGDAGYAAKRRGHGGTVVSSTAATITGVSLSPSTFAAQPGSASTTEGTFSATVVGGVFGGNYTLPIPTSTIASASIDCGTSCSYSSGVVSGTTIGNASATLSAGLFSGTWSTSGAAAADFTFSGNHLQANGATPTCTSQTALNLNIVATQPGGTNSPFPAAITVTCNPVVVGGGTCNSASCQVMGTYQANNVANFCPTMGRCPDAIIDRTFTLPGGTGWDPAINSPYPVVTGVGLFGGSCGIPSYTDIANGICDSAYAQQDNQVVGYLDHVYWLRLGSEWSGSTSTTGTGCTSNCPSDFNQIHSNPSLFINAWRHRIQLLKTAIANSSWSPDIKARVKLQFDAPYGWRFPSDEQFWDYDDLVDLTGLDQYMVPGPATGQQNWSNGEQCGQDAIPCSSNSALGYLKDFAARHNKPIVFSEWCDGYADGYQITKIAQWMNDTGNFVGADYWNSEDSEPNCSLYWGQAKLDAYKAAFGNGRTFQTTYWPVHLQTIDNRYQ